MILYAECTLILDLYNGNTNFDIKLFFFFFLRKKFDSFDKFVIAIQTIPCNIIIPKNKFNLSYY